MSITLIKDIINSITGLNPTQKMIKIIIASYCEEGRKTAYPSFGTIAKLAEISDRQAKKIVAFLKDKGHLKVKSGDGRKSNVYTVVVNPVTQVNSVTPVNPVTHQGCPTVHRSGELSDIVVVNQSSPYQVKNNNRTSNITRAMVDEIITIWGKSKLKQPDFLKNGIIDHDKMSYKNLAEQIRKLLKIKGWKESFIEAVSHCNRSAWARGELDWGGVTLRWATENSKKLDRMMDWKAEIKKPKQPNPQKQALEQQHIEADQARLDAEAEERKGWESKFNTLPTKDQGEFMDEAYKFFSELSEKEPSPNLIRARAIESYKAKTALEGI